MNRQELVKRRAVRRILYTFRRIHGVPADLYKVTITDPNYETGRLGVSRTKVSLPQVITGSVELMKKFEYDLGYVKANSNFTYGATFEVGDRIAIIDGIYLQGYEIQQKDYVVYDTKRYDMVKIHKMDGEVGYILHLRVTKGQKTNQILERKIISQLPVVDEVSYEF